jgi:hypothetical protein
MMNDYCCYSCCDYGGSGSGCRFYCCLTISSYGGVTTVDYFAASTPLLLSPQELLPTLSPLLSSPPSPPSPVSSPRGEDNPNQKSKQKNIIVYLPVILLLAAVSATSQSSDLISPSVALKSKTMSFPGPQI